MPRYFDDTCNNWEVERTVRFDKIVEKVRRVGDAEPVAVEWPAPATPFSPAAGPRSPPARPLPLPLEAAPPTTVPGDGPLGDSSIFLSPSQGAK